MLAAEVNHHVQRNFYLYYSTEKVQYAQLDLSHNWDGGNATANAISGRTWISDCKPYPIGPFGIVTFFNNSMNICPSGVTLEQGARVRLLERWTTPLRRYHHVKIQYKVGDNIRTGWIFAGHQENYWLNVVPDDKNKPFVSAISSNNTLSSRKLYSKSYWAIS